MITALPSTPAAAMYGVNWCRTAEISLAFSLGHAVRTALYTSSCDIVRSRKTGHAQYRCMRTAPNRRIKGKIGLRCLFKQSILPGANPFEQFDEHQQQQRYCDKALFLPTSVLQIFSFREVSLAYS